MIFSNKLFIPAWTIVKPFRPFGLLSLHHNIPRILHPLPRSRREETAHTHCAFYLLIGSDGSKRELVASCPRSKSLLRAQKSLAHNSCSSIPRRGYEINAHD
ncbi:Chaperone DnaJ [Gossypium australe]|uniref:Chaperone DnaJ n=1 Tax=Gossypium australe TaxID=47621 RepID=A0A5B6ULV4_9ROSI|nr:Chaperone DnaJ [Gossypium australe]